jgi:uncharacterized protein
VLLVSAYVPGTPCWAGLRSPAPEVSVAFYTQLLGWQAGPPAANGYVMFSLGGKQVAGVGPLLNNTRPPGWCTYIASQNVEVTAATASAAGARVLIPPFDVPGSGRVAVLIDPTGADVWLWQPAGFNGAQVIGEPGAMCWNELDARDIDTAKAFYASVFGWQTATIPYQGNDCLAWVLDGKVIGGLVEIRNEGQSTTPPANWLVSFAVHDLYPAVTKANALGGKTHVAAGGASPLRSTVLFDPHGIRFSIAEVPDIPGLQTLLEAPEQTT